MKHRDRSWHTPARIIGKFFLMTADAVTIGIERGSIIAEPGCGDRVYAVAERIGRSSSIAKRCGVAGGGLASEQAKRIGTRPISAPETGENLPDLSPNPLLLLDDGGTGAVGGPAARPGGGGPWAEEGQTQDEDHGGTAKRRAGHESGSFRGGGFRRGLQDRAGASPGVCCLHTCRKSPQERQEI